MNLLTSNYQYCFECHKTVTDAVEMGVYDSSGHRDQESGGTFCADCLRAAVALIEATQPQKPRPGDFVAGFIFTAEGDTIFRIGTWPGKNAAAPQEEQQL